MSEAIGPQSSGDAARARLRQRLIAAAVALVLAIGAALAAIIVPSQRQSSPTAATTSASPSPSRTPTETATPAPPPAPVQPPPPPPPSLPDLPPGPMNILVLGSDIAGSTREATEHQAATGERADQRSDTIMLIHIPADRHRIFGISIMRDNWVNIPGYGVSKINASLTLGGPPLVIDTVSSLLNTHIDHYVMTDFGGIKAFIDALGGIDVNVPIAFTSTTDTHHTFEQGVNTLDGQASLEFVRERKAFIDGDYQRVRDQQALVRALMFHLLNTGRVHDAASAIGIIAMAMPVLTVDSGFDPTALATLAFALRGTDPAASVFFTLPTAGTGFSADGQSIVLPDYGGIAEVAAALAADRLDDYAATHGL